MTNENIRTVSFEVRLLQAMLEGWTINGEGFIFYFCCECQEFIRMENNGQYPNIISHGYCSYHLDAMYSEIYHGE